VRTAQDALREARSEEEVLAAVRSYLRAAEPATVHLLPPECVPRAIEGVDDVAELALAHARCGIKEHPSPEASGMARFLMDATTRLASLGTMRTHALYIRLQPRAGTATREA
jgi:hypothetical protein